MERIQSPPDAARTAAMSALRSAIGQEAFGRLRGLLGTHGLLTTVQRMLEAADRAYLIALRANGEAT